jgi:arabinogalactan endo-1,4-beta-galactosidase
MKKMVLLLMILSSCSNLTEKPVDYGYLSNYDAQFDPTELDHPKRLPHRNDFIRGVDVSTYEEVILKGGVYLNEYGENIDDDLRFGDDIIIQDQTIQSPSK